MLFHNTEDFSWHDKKEFGTILTIARSVRKSLKAESHLYPEMCTPDLRGYCGKATILLHRKLKQAGIFSRICHKRSLTCTHFFLRIRGHILDVTATQFLMPTICLVPAKKIEKHWHWWQNDHRISHAKAVHELSWWQEPFTIE